MDHVSSRSLSGHLECPETGCKDNSSTSSQPQLNQTRATFASGIDMAHTFLRLHSLEECASRASRAALRVSFRNLKGCL